MTSAPVASWRRVFTIAQQSPTVLWAAFVLAHLWLGYLNLVASNFPLGDVEIQYRDWAEQAELSHYVIGIDAAWVYPIVAIVPMLLSGAFGFANYVGTWLSLVFILDLVAFAALVGWRRTGRRAKIGWWWIAFLLLLGPIALGRIDSISVPIAIVAVLLLASRPALASALLTVAAWIKVWPAALIAAILVASRARVRIAIAALGTSIGIIVIALTLGSGMNVFSFISQQTGRGLQVESPVSTIWMWLSVFRIPGAFPYYDQQINTFEVTGPGANIAAAIMSPILAAVFLAIVVLGIVAVRRGVSGADVLAPLSLALVTAFIAFNKVGSPQYMTWLAVPVILGLTSNAIGHGRSFRFPALVTLVVAVFTQLLYPYLYQSLIDLEPNLVLALTLRNLLIFVLFGWSVGVLAQLCGRSLSHRDALEQTGDYFEQATQKIDGG
jgi:hypothetical protein